MQSFPYTSAVPWRQIRPTTLVVACSDGRFHLQLDEFLHEKLKLERYDRLYLPGGPGALADSAQEFLRIDICRNEFRFLLDAHSIEEVILLPHGGSEDGPEIAMCADYTRKFPGRPTADLRAQQAIDTREVADRIRGWSQKVRISAYRAEVTADGHVTFVPLPTEPLSGYSTSIE
jgi:hypothetical protein